MRPLLLVLLILANQASGDPKTPYQTAQDFYMQGNTAKGLLPERLWVGYCSNYQAPTVLIESALSLQKIEDPFTGDRYFLIPLFSKRYVTGLDAKSIQSDFIEVMNQPNFYYEYFPLYEDKGEGALASRLYAPPPTTEPGGPKGQLKYIYFVRQNVSETGNDFYSLKMLDFNTNRVVRYCYYFKERNP